MISAPNLRPLLNGSSWGVTILMTAFLLAGCGIFGPATKKTDKDEDPSVLKGTPTRIPAPVDTIEWNIVSEEEAPPITERTALAITEFKDVYNLTLLAPFGARNLQSSSDRVSARMVRMIEFLAGVQYATENCLDDVKVKLNIIDTEDDSQFEQNFTKLPAITEADIIIGPYYTNKVEAVSRYALENNKIMISPWNTVQLDVSNPYYIQMRPSLKSHAQRIARYATENYLQSEVMLMTKNDPRDIESLAYFQYNPVTMDSTPRFYEEIVPDIGSSDLTDSLAVYIQEKGYRRFIIPVWSDEPFVIAALAKLNFAKGEEEITVLGLPQWMEMSRMDYDYFENLHVHLSTARPAEYTSNDAKGLRSNYINRFGDTPGTEAYYGMNLMKWLGKLLASEGVLITNGLGKKIEGLDEEFDFVAIFGEDGESIHHYENQKVDIIEFSEYRFRKVD